MVRWTFAEYILVDNRCWPQPDLSISALHKGPQKRQKRLPLHSALDKGGPKSGKKGHPSILPCIKGTKKRPQRARVNQHPLVHCLLFTILHPFGTRKSIRRKADHGGQIVLWYWQHATNLAKATCHATNLAKATMFVVYMSSTRVLLWVRGKAKQKRSLTFCVFGQTRSKCSSSFTFPKS
jgi:hypothetical protein